MKRCGMPLDLLKISEMPLATKKEEEEEEENRKAFNLQNV